MRFLYYCNSTYQLMNILNLHDQRKHAGFESLRDYTGELMVQDSFEGASAIAKIIEEKGYFNKVFLVNKAFNNGGFHTLQTLIDQLFPAHYLSDKYHLNSNEIKDRYDVICAPKYSMLIDQIWRLNRKASMHLLEDGIGTYSYSILFYPRSKRIEQFRKILKVNRFENYERLYLVNPAMYAGEHLERVHELPRFEPSFLNEIRQAFLSFSEGYEEKKIYWLSQFLNNEEFNRMMAEVLKTFVDHKEDVLFCQHPRTPMKNVHGFAETDGKQIFELLMLNMHDIDKKLFVAIHSTACFTPKMLYDKEPYVLMFYRLGDPAVTYATKEFEECVARFKASYSDPDKIMIPNDLEEFKECFRKYCEKEGLE